MSEPNKENNESDIFSEPSASSAKITARTKHKSEAKRQLRALLIVLAAAIVGALLYFFVLKPLLAEAPEPPSEEVVLLDGEVLGSQNRIMIMDYIKRDQIASIDVHNKYGDWGVYYDEADDEFYIKDAKGAAYDREMLQELFSAAGYTLSMERIAEYTDNFSQFGLSELDAPAWYVISDREGNSHKLYIGDPIPSNAGYYVRYDGRDAVYVLDQTIEKTLLAPIEALISPLLAVPVSTSTYFQITNMYLLRNNELVVAMQYLSDEERKQSGTSAIHKFLYPEQYVPNDSKYLSMFEKFTDYEGMSTLVFKPTAAELADYGLDKPEFDLYFEFSGVPTNIIFSTKNDNGNYYAYSPLFDIITEVEAANAAFLEWTLIDWIERPLFLVNINTVRSISVDTAEQSYEFVLESENETLKNVRETVSGKAVDVELFRKFYQTILMTELQDYTGLDRSELDALKEAGAYMTLKIRTSDERVREFCFYPYETRRSFYTVNGDGKFYILRDRMNKIVSDAGKVLSGEDIVPDANQ